MVRLSEMSCPFASTAPADPQIAACARAARRRAASCALSTVSMKGRRMWRNFSSNWARMALPKVSAVMPVPSEMKKTEGLGMKKLSVKARPQALLWCES